MSFTCILYNSYVIHYAQNVILYCRMATLQLNVIIIPYDFDYTT